MKLEMNIKLKTSIEKIIYYLNGCIRHNNMIIDIKQSPYSQVTIDLKTANKSYMNDIEFLEEMLTVNEISLDEHQNLIELMSEYINENI